MNYEQIPRVLFWDDRVGPSREEIKRAYGRKLTGKDKLTLFFVDLVGHVMSRRTFGQPQDHIRRDIPMAVREELAKVLENGERGISYMGWADCRICGERLGTADMVGHGFVWPERAEHYVLKHDVWTPGCDALLVASRRK